VHFSDNETRIQKEGTIYIIPGSHTIVYINPVYQTTSGQVFLEPGGGFSVSQNETDGMIFAQTLSESTTITENGAENTHSISITTNIEAMFPPTRYSIIELCEDNIIIAVTEFMPSEAPQAIYTATNTAYIIVETHSPRARLPISRELINYGDAGISIFISGDDDIILKCFVAVVWP